MFITFEGIGGAGKTTQVRLLKRWLVGDGHDVIDVREPGTTQLGETLRKLLLRGFQVTPFAEAALFAAARAEMAHTVICPALARNAWVISDRYLDSSLAYQGIVEGVGMEEVLQINLALTGGLMPDLTFVLAIDVDEALRRRAKKIDRIERRERPLLDRLTDAYALIAQKFPDRVVMLDGSLPRDELAARIRDELSRARSGARSPASAG